jgi:hypothetical protein
MITQVMKALHSNKLAHRSALIQYMCDVALWCQSAGGLNMDFFCVTLHFGTGTGAYIGINPPLDRLLVYKRHIVVMTAWFTICRLVNKRYLKRRELRRLRLKVFIS